MGECEWDCACGVERVRDELLFTQPCGRQGFGHWRRPETFERIHRREYSNLRRPRFLAQKACLGAYAFFAQFQRVLPGPSSLPHEREQTSSEQHLHHEKWEELGVPSSLTSSYPSLTFPSGTQTPHSHPHQYSHHDPATRSPQPSAGPLAARGATHAALDTTLSPRSRTLAILSSIAINVLLPFVNGVMLGFGEIFAQNVVVRWFGGQASSRFQPGYVAAGVGLRKGRQGESLTKDL